jgi:hypothetical protein
MPTAAEPVDFLDEVRPLAREVAFALVRQELVGLGVSLNGAGPATEVAPGGRQLPQEASNGGGDTLAMPLR